MDVIGPSFGDEVIAAGLGGLPFSWGSDGSITGRERLTPEQNATLDAVISAHDPLAQTAAKVRSNEFVADLTRAEILDKLKTATPTQIETFVRSRLDANAVTNLATAVLFCKRVETAFVQVVKVLARNIGDGNGN